LTRAVPHTLTNVFARNDEIVTRLMAAAQDNMRVGIVGVPVVDGYPVKTRAEVDFHLLHELAGEALQVPELGGIFGSHDEAELSRSPLPRCSNAARSTPSSRAS
jgi:hypothetical protein